MNRLIFPVRATLALVDAVATAAAPGYDPDFAELRLVDRDGDGVADGARAELPPLELLAQVEPQTQERLAMTPAGDVPDTRLSLVFHTRHLHRQGLYSRVTGSLGLRAGDRLVALRSLTGATLWTPRAGCELYLVEARLTGWGLGRVPRANLVVAAFEPRPATRRAT